jgi:phosphoglycolate phosphatase
MRPDALIFDLDGTLWDTSETCAAAWNRVTRELGIEARSVTADDIRTVAGLPHTEGVRRIFNELREADVLRISERSQVEDNRALAESGGLLFPGVSERVPHLSATWPLMIVSNCQSGYIEVFLRTSGLVNHFADFECWGNTGRTKGENLASVIDRNRLRTPWFIGDTESDWLAARENGVHFVHAGYGFGTVADSHARIERFAELDELLAR